jgi:hypothetical protein
MQEALHILKGAFAEKPLTFVGKHYTITHLESFPKPSQKPHPPLLIGAGSKRMLSIAAREANIIGILPKALTNGTISEDPTERFAETLAQKVEWIRQAAGERFYQIELSLVVTVELTHDQHQKAEQILQKRGWSGLTAEQVLEMPSMLIGSIDQITEKIHILREKYTFSYFVISDTCLETFAPIVAQLTGKYCEVEKWIKESKILKAGKYDEHFLTRICASQKMTYAMSANQLSRSNAGKMRLTTAQANPHRILHDLPQIPLAHASHKQQYHLQSNVDGRPLSPCR